MQIGMADITMPAIAFFRLYGFFDPIIPKIKPSNPVIPVKTGGVKKTIAPVIPKILDSL